MQVVIYVNIHVHVNNDAIQYHLECCDERPDADQLPGSGSNVG